jgi:hypothetical protein
MSQHDFTVDNGAGVAVRADINLALKALASQSSGASAPSPTFPAQVWADTGTGRLKQRNAANSAWVDKGPIDGPMAPLDSPVFTTLVQVPNAATANQAVAFGQVCGVVGQARNARLYQSTASSIATFTADEVVVETVLGGLRYCLPNVNKTINLGTVGAGGMDTGAAPVSGFVGLYAIYNPSTAASALLAVNASALVGQVYGGANMPAGYTASALIAVLPTNASSQFLPVLLRDRRVSFAPRTAISTNTMAGSPTALSVSGSIPANAVSVGGSFGLTSTVASNLSTTLSEDAVNALAGSQFALNGVTLVNTFELDVTGAQFIYYQCASSAGTPTYGINTTSYRF